MMQYDCSSVASAVAAAAADAAATAATGELVSTLMLQMHYKQLEQMSPAGTVIESMLITIVMAFRCSAENEQA